MNGTKVKEDVMKLFKFGAILIAIGVLAIIGLGFTSTFPTVGELSSKLVSIILTISIGTIISGTFLMVISN